MARIIKWGILGAGRISSDFAQCLHHAHNAELIAVGSRTLSVAQTFAKEYNVPTAYGTYEDLLKDKNVEAVYIGTPHTGHKDAALLAINHGKHVLVEKPAGMNKKEVDEMIAAAKKAKVFFMEAMWTRCFPLIKQIRKLLSDGELGTVKTLIADFGFKLTGPNERLTDPGLGGGCVLDIGVYPIFYASMVFGGKPDKILATGSLFPTGADEQVSISLGYPTGFANIFLSFAANTPRRAVIVGTKGKIEVQYPFWCPTSFTLTLDSDPSAPKTFTEELPKSEHLKKFYHSNSEGLSYEAIHASECIAAGLLESPLCTTQESSEVADVCDQIRKQIGVVYAADK